MKAQLDFFSTPLPTPKPNTDTTTNKSEQPNKLEKTTILPIKSFVGEVDNPNKILISSDGSEVEFVRIVKGTELYVYKYTKGLEKVGTEVSWSKDYIKSQLKNYFRIIS